MSGIKLGDYTLDCERVLYLHSLRACVVSDLGEAAAQQSVEDLQKKFEVWRERYQPEILIILGEMRSADFKLGSPVRALLRAWTTTQTRLIWVCPQIPKDCIETLDSLHCEVHQELIWGRYRFGFDLEDATTDNGFLTITARPHFSVKFASRILSSRFLSVFLKGQGHIVLPSLGPKISRKSVLRSSLARYDVFAVGHQRVLPLGKVADLRARRRLWTGLKLSVSNARTKEGSGDGKFETLAQ